MYSRDLGEEMNENDTPRENILKLLESSYDYEALKERSTEDLRLIYAERVTLQVISQNGKESNWQ